MRAGRALVAFGASLFLPACFDVKEVDATGRAPLQIDDFEDGDQVPLSGPPAIWQCYSWQVGASAPTCLTVQPGFQSGSAEALAFELDAPADATKVDTVGVGLGFFPPDLAALDVRSWESLNFDAKFAPSTAASSAATVVWVRLNCNYYLDGQGAILGRYRVEDQIDVATDWASFRLPWAAFAQPSYQPTLHTPDCLKQVDGIVFEVGLSDGQSGTLTIDNVSLE